MQLSCMVLDLRLLHIRLQEEDAVSFHKTIITNVDKLALIIDSSSKTNNNEKYVLHCQITESFYTR